MENSAFHITCHLDPDAKIRESKRALEGNGTEQRLKVYPYNSQGQLPRTKETFTRRHCLEPDLCEFLLCRACKSVASPRGDPL